MTRNNEIDLQDLIECDHALEIPVTEGVDIVYWMCRCGKKKIDASEVEEERAKQGLAPKTR